MNIMLKKINLIRRSKMKKLILITLTAILCAGCVYPRYFRPMGTNHIMLQDSVDVTVSYMELVNNFSKRHVGSVITIKTFDKSKLPFEINIDSLKSVKTKYFDLIMDTLDVSKRGILKGNTISFPDSYFHISLLYHVKDFKISDKKQYSETQKVWIPSFVIKQGGKEYIKSGFEAVYPNH